MPELTKEQFIKFNQEAAKRGIAPVKPVYNPLERGLGTEAPKAPVDAIGKHMLEKDQYVSSNSVKQSFYSTAEKLGAIQARQTELANKLKSASNKSFVNPSAEVKDRIYLRPSTSDRDKLLAQYIDAAKEDKTVRDADQRMRSLAFTIGQGQLPEAKEQVKKIDNMINNNHKTLGDWDGAKDLNKFKDNIILKEYGVNDDLIKEYQNHINTNPAIASSNTKLLFKLAEIGAARKNMDAAEYNALYNDENFLNFKRELQAGNKDALTGPTGYAALSAFRDVLTKAYQVKYKPLIDKLNTLTNSPEDLKLRSELEAQIDKGNKELKAFDSRINTSEYAKLKRANDAALREAEDNIFAAGAARIRNVAVGVLSNVGVLNEAGSLKESDFALDFRTQPMKWHTGEFDTNGNPVLSDAVVYKGVDGHTSIGWGGLLEAATTQGVQMYMTAGLTKVLAGVGGAIANVGKGAGFMKAARATQAELLNSEIGVRALTFPAVYMTTYPRTYYENIGNFKSSRELKDYAQATSMMEAGSESFIPDYNVVRGLKMNLPTNLSASQLKFYAKYLTDAAKGTTKKQFWKTLGQTTASTFNKTFQEAIVEEELNYAAGALYQHYQSNGGQDNNYRNTQDYSVQGAIDLALEGTLTMLPTMILGGARQDYRHFSKQNNYNFNKPGSLSYHRWNVATNANYFREQIMSNEDISAEEKGKINAGITEYENTLKRAVQSVVKPDEKTLANDEANTYIYFDALINKERIEPRILAETASKEDIELYSNSEKAIALIDRENKDWMKLSPQEKQNKWFKWYGESISDRGYENIEKSTFAQMEYIKGQREQVNKLAEDKQISPELKDRYTSVIDVIEKYASENALELFQENLKKIKTNDNISANDIAYLANYDLPLAMESATNPEEFYKEHLAILSDEFNKKNSTEKEVKEKIEETLAPVEEVPIQEELKAPTRFDKFNNMEGKEKRAAIKQHFESLPKEDVNREILDYTAIQSPEKMEALMKALDENDFQTASTLVPAELENIVLSMKKEEQPPVEIPTEEAAPVSDIEAKKADIERRRQEEIDKIIKNIFPNTKLNQIVYHGTRTQERFTKFDENKIGDLDSGYFGRGFYFSPDKSYAEGYSKPYNGYTISAILNLENPLETDANKANTNISLNNYDGAIVRVGENLNPELNNTYYDSNEIGEVIVKNSNQIHILSKQELESIDKINAKYDAELKALEGETKEEEEIASLTNIDEVTTEDNEDKEYSLDVRPNSGLITISDEYDWENEKQDTPFSKAINEFLDKLKENFASNPYKGKLVSNTSLFSNLKIDVAKIQETIDSYWKNELIKEQALQILNKEFKNTISPGAIEWHLSEDISDVNKSVYGITDAKKKFQDVTLKSFSLVVLDKKSSKIVRYGATQQPIVRALPKVKKEKAGYRFYSIEPLEYTSIQPELEDLYNVQEAFRANQSSESILVSLDKVSNGFDFRDAIEIAHEGSISIVTEERPGLKKGMVVDGNNRRLWSRRISPEDAKVLAHIIKNEIEDEYRYQLVYLSPKEKESVQKMSIDDLESFLEKKRYNVVGKALNNPFKHMTLVDGNLVKGREAFYEDFISKKLVRYEIKKEIRGGNKKIYFSRSTEIEEPQPLANEAPITPVIKDDMIVIHPETKEPITVGKLKAHLEAVEARLTQLENIADRDPEDTMALNQGYIYLSKIQDALDNASPIVEQAPVVEENKKEDGPIDGFVDINDVPKNKVTTRPPTTFDELNFPKSIISEQTLLEKQRAFVWFKQSFISKDFKLNLAFVDNPRAFASFTNTAITLYKGSDFTMLYHEAWHRFTQHYISKQEKQKLYSAVKSLVSNEKLTPKEYRAMEESLAEAFRSYMLNGEEFTIKIGDREFKIDSSKPKENHKGILGIFKSIKDFFSRLFSKQKTAEDLISKYMKEASRSRSLRKSDVSNTYFKVLNTERLTPLVTKDGENVALDYAAMYEMNQAIDYLFVESFNEMTKNNITSLMSASKAQRENLGNQLYDIVLDKIEKKAASIEDEDKKKEFKAVIDNFDLFKSRASDFRKSLVGNIKERVNESLEDLEDETTNQGLNAEFYENLSNYEHADEAIINAVRLLPAVDKAGNKILSDYWGLPQLDDFNKNWTILAKNLTGLDFPQMEAKIKSLIPKYPQFKDLLRNLEVDYTSSKLTPMMVRNKFEKVFNMVSVQEMLTLMSTNEAGETQIKFIESGTSLPKEILKQWDNEFTSDYQVSTNGDKILDTNKLFDEFKTGSNMDIAEALKFLKAIGVEYTNKTEVKELLEKDSNNPNSTFYDFLPSVKRVYSKLKNMHSVGEVVTYPMEAIASPHGKGARVTWGESSSLELLAKAEIETNEVLSDDQMVRADGNQSWKYMQRSYVTNFTSDLKNLSYEQLKEKYPQLDTFKNPEISNSYFFNSLFKYNSETNSYKKREGASLDLLKTGGLKSEDVDSGEVTIDLTPSDKLMMDFYSFITSGVEEAVRFADKSTTSAFSLTVKDGMDVTASSPLERQMKRIKEQIRRQIIGEIKAIQDIKSIPEEEKESLKFYLQNYEDRDATGKGVKPDKGLRFIYGAMTYNNGKDMLIPIGLQSELAKAKLVKEGTGYYSFENETDAKMIDGFIDEYFKSKGIEFRLAFAAAHGNKDLDYKKLLPSKFKDDTEDKVFEYYYAYSTMNRIEQFNFVYGSPRNYKNGDDVFKRIAAYGAVGKYASVDQQYLRWMNTIGGYQRNIEKLHTSKHREYTDGFTMVHFLDEEVNLPFASEKALKKNTILTPAEKKQIENYYNDGEQTDASGNCTLDFYRMFMMGIGEWDNKKDNAYNLQLAFEAAKLEFAKNPSEENSNAMIEARLKANAGITDLTSILNVKKLQYAGSIYSPHTLAARLDLRAFEKFSVAPLLPSAIEGSRWEKIAENMYMTGTDMTNFNTGSKMNWDQKAESFSDWYSSSKKSFIPSVLSLNNLKEQLPIEDKMKTTGIFASQMRKLLSVGLFEKGEKVQGRESALAHYEAYKDSVKNITELVKAELAEKFSSPKKLVEYIRQEFGKRDIPDHVKAFVEYYEAEDRLKDPLDLSFQSFQLQNVLFSIVNNKIIKQKFSGGQFIQAPNTGYTNATEEQTSEYGDGDLNFYHVDENGIVQPMEVKIAFSPKYHSLLKIKWNDEQIGDLDTLNDLLKDEEFVKEHGDKFTMVGCRIPVQGFSTIETMRVKKFLPATIGQIVIVPAGLTIKSGSDFDIDKLNIYEPAIDAEGNLAASEEDPLEMFKIALSTIESNNSRIAEINDKLKLISEEIEQDELEAEEESSEDIFANLSGRTLSLEDLQSQDTENKKRISTLRADFKDEKLALKAEKLTLKESNREWKNYKKSLSQGELNRLISSVAGLTLDRKNFENLMTRNELYYLANEYDLKGISKGSLSMSDVVDPIISNQVFEKNTVGKKSLGIDAKANTFFALALEAGLKINKPSPSILSQNINEDGSLSFSTIMSQPSANGKTGAQYQPQFIPRTISEFISGHVDIAKDSRIAEIKADRLRTPLYLYMIMSGTHLHDAVEFLSLPHIINLVDKYKRQESIVYKNYITAKVGKEKAGFELLQSKVLKDELNSYAETNKNKVFKTNSKGEFVKDKKGNAIVDYYKTSIAIINNKENILNKKLLDVAQFYILMEDQNKFKTLTSAVSWDTNTSKNFVEMYYPKLQLDAIKAEEWFNSEAIEQFENESVISSLEASGFVRKHFSDSFSIIDNPAFIENTINLFNTTYGAKLENFSRDFQNDFLTFLFQNFATLPESDVSSYQKLIVDMKLLDKDNPKNIQNRFQKAVSAIKDVKLQNNLFLNKLTFRKDKKSQTMAPELKNSNIDIHTSNLLHNDLLKLLSPDFNAKQEDLDELRKAAKALVEVTSLLNGVNKTFRGFQALIPTDTFTNSFRTILDNPIVKEQISNIDSPLYQLFMGVQDENGIYKGGLFQQNRGKYFKRLKKTKDYSSTDKYNYFVPDIWNSLENSVSLYMNKEQEIVQGYFQMSDITNHSGGAIGADSMFDTIGKEFGQNKHIHYYFGAKTPKGNRLLSQSEVDEGIVEMNKAAKILNRFPKKQAVINLLARNWFQVKNSTQIIAIAPIDESMKFVEGGTGWAVAMAQGTNKEINVFNLKDNSWYKWNGSIFVSSSVPKLHKNFAGIGSRQDNGKMTEESIQAIKDVYINSQEPKELTQRTVREVSGNEDFELTNIPSSDEVINIYSGTNENAHLSNFAIRPFIIEGEEYQSVEQYFQYQKWNYLKEDITESQFKEDQKIASAIMNTSNGATLKSLGGKFKNLNSTSWDKNSSKEMKDALKASFEQNPDALAKLLATGNAQLTHIQDKGKWGKEFPRLLMEVRNELKNQELTQEDIDNLPCQ